MQNDRPSLVEQTGAAAPEVAFVCDEDGAILDASEGAAELLGLPVDAMRGRPLARLAVRDDQEAVVRGLAAARQSGRAQFSARLRGGGDTAVRTQLAAWTLEVRGTRVTVCVALADAHATCHAEERARRLADTQKVIATILELALQDRPLEDLLQRTLDLVLWIPWLSIEHKGAIFLVADEDPNALVLAVSRGLDAPLLSTCSRMPFGTCLCGLAAASRAPVYAADLDARHTTRYPGIRPHGHYCIPICSGDATLGVINTYLVAGHEPSAIDLEFLMAVADTLAGVLIRRRAAAERDMLRRRLDDALLPARLGGAADAARELEGLMSVLLASAKELLEGLPPTDPLRAAAEEIERAARRGVGLASELDTSDRSRSRPPRR